MALASPIRPYLAEGPLVVVHAVGGSSPLAHPSRNRCKAATFDRLGPRLSGPRAADQVPIRHGGTRVPSRSERLIAASQDDEVARDTGNQSMSRQCQGAVTLRCRFANSQVRRGWSSCLARGSGRSHGALSLFEPAPDEGDPAARLMGSRERQDVV